MKKGKPIRYITKCGCELESSGIKRIRNERNSWVRVCIEHGGRIVSRKRECIDCGMMFGLHLVGPGVDRCESCSKAEKLKKRRARDKKRWKDKCKAQVAIKIEAWNYDKRGDYCSWMKSCISNKVLRCDGCRKFDGVFFGYDPGKKYA